MNILLSGDSWGVGELTHDHVTNARTFTHPGIELYMKEYGCNVFNVSQRSLSNNEIYSRTVDFLNSGINIDYIIFFHANFYRDFKDLPINVLKKHFTSIEKIKNFKRNYYNNLYAKLNKLGPKIILLGCIDKIEPFDNDYKNLIPLLPSIPEFLFPNFKHWLVYETNWVSQIENLLDNSTLQELYNSRMSIKELNTDKYAHYFRPDGYHPNRHGAYKVYEKIIEFIESQSLENT
jgi:hypothetical protein